MQSAKKARQLRRDRRRVLINSPFSLLAIGPIMLLGLGIAAGGAQRGGPPERPVPPVGDEQVIEGTDENDTLTGGDGADWMYGEKGDDLLLGNAGDDMLEGREGDDTLDGGADDDVIDGGEGADRLFGGAGDDVMDGGDQDDILDGGEGADNLSGGDGADLLSGGPGNDTIYGDDEDDIAKGGEGADRLYGRDGADTLHGGPGDDLLDGGDSTDVLLGGPGADRLVAGAGDDIARGGPGQDVLEGGAGMDLLDGGGGGDSIYGGLNDDVLVGGSGADVLQGGRGADDVSAGEDDDTVRLRAGDGAPGLIDKVDGGGGVDTLQLNGFPAGVCSEPGDETSRCGAGLVDPESGGALEVRGVEVVRHEHVTLAIADGAAARAILVNPTASPVAAQVDLHASDGASLASAGKPEADEDAGEERVGSVSSELTVPPHSRLTVPLPASVAGASVTLRVDSDERLIVVLEQGGDAAIQARETPIADSFYVPFADPRDTRLHIVKGAVGGTVKIDHLLREGGEVDSYQIGLAARGHVDLAMGDIFPEASSAGILRIEGGELGAAGSITDVERGAGMLAALPASIDFSVGGPGAPGRGGRRYITGLLGSTSDAAEIFVFNPGTVDAKGTLRLHDASGQPVTVTVEEKGSVSSVPVELSGGGVMTVRLTGAGTDVYAVLQTDEGGADAVLGRRRGSSYLTARAQRPGGGRAFAILGPAAADMVHVRVVAAERSRVTLQLRGVDGEPVAGGQRVVDLGAGAAVHGTLAELFPGLPGRGTETLDGSLQVVATQGAIVVTGVIVREGEAHALPSVALR